MSPIAITAEERMRVLSTRVPEQVDDVIGRIASRSFRTKADIARCLIIKQLIDGGLAEPLGFDDFISGK